MYFFDHSLFLPLYIDPNSGFQIFSQSGPFAAFLLAFLGVLFWPLKIVFQFIEKHLGRKGAVISLSLVLLSAAAGILLFQFRHGTPEASGKKVIVLGLDGLDHTVTSSMMSQGKLPHLSRLKDMGSYTELRTVHPPQSPVAWSTFATGLNPAEHRLFDFLQRDADAYTPRLALSEVDEEAVTFLGVKLPMKKRVFRNRRRGEAFWKMLSNRNIPSYVYHCPMTFPPDEVKGAMLSGMGVPDIRGTQGSFSFYTTALQNEAMQGGNRVPISFRGMVSETFFKGPIAKDGRMIEIPFKVQRTENAQKILIHWQDKQLVLNLNEWSPWIRVRFDGEGIRNIWAMARFFLKSTEPDFELYLSAFNFVPERPAHNITYPKHYSKTLRDEIGDFHTLGMPHDTWALNEGAMSEEMFLEQTQTILDEEFALLKSELAKFKQGVFVFAVVTPDRVQHMFWRATDPKSPLYTDELNQKYGHVIEETYKKMDDLVGYVMSTLDEQTTFLVISDHGFTSFRRAVHINSWLRQEGYLNYKDKQLKSGKPFFEEVDWSQTKAYALGLGGVYLNMADREGRGIVKGHEMEPLKKELMQKLLMARDENGELFIRRVFTKDEIFEGTYHGEAPDLLIGFHEGYRASWQTALGASPAEVVENNLKKWSGDHIVDPELVPGVLFSNRKITADRPSLYDMAPTILSLFDVEHDLKGRDLFK